MRRLPAAPHFKNPYAIQAAVSKLPYNPDDYCKSASRVFQEGTAHCMEGAIAASWALERLGHAPQLLHFRAHRDDDHVVALFREKGRWGAVGKSNTTLLRWRPPLYKTVEALFLSYFPFYFNTKKQPSLYGWSGPVKLTKYDHWNWRHAEGDISDMSATFYDHEKKHQIMTIRALGKLPKVDEILMNACFLGANKKGLFQAL